MVEVINFPKMVRTILIRVEQNSDCSFPVFLTCFLLLLTLSAPVMVWGCDDAEDCFSRYTIEELFRTAVAFSTGEGGVQDSRQAVLWMRRAANRGHLYAQFNLGEAYLNGYGVEQSNPEGISWLQRSANGGLADAQVSLGLKYDEGVGVVQDLKLAVKWFRRAAKQGNRDAQNNLGIAYAAGEGVPKDYVQAYRWFDLAQIAGHPASGEYRDRIAQDMNPKQLREAQR